MLATEVRYSAGRRSELCGTSHSRRYAETVAAFRTDVVGYVLASKADREEAVAIRRRFRTGKTLAYAFGEMVRIHVRMNGVGIRLASADNNDALPRKIIPKDFVGRRVGIVDMDLANEIDVGFFASEDADKIRAEQIVGKTFVSNEYHRCGPKHVTEVHEHLADMVARQLYVTLGRKVSVIGKTEVV